MGNHICAFSSSSSSTYPSCTSWRRLISSTVVTDPRLDFNIPKQTFSFFWVDGEERTLDVCVLMTSSFDIM